MQYKIRVEEELTREAVVYIEADSEDEAYEIADADADGAIEAALAGACVVSEDRRTTVEEEY